MKSTESIKRVTILLDDDLAESLTMYRQHLATKREFDPLTKVVSDLIKHALKAKAFYKEPEGGGPKKGRGVKRSKEEWQRLYDEWKESTLPLNRFCKEKRLPSSSVRDGFRRYLGWVGNEIVGNEIVCSGQEHTEEQNQS